MALSSGMIFADIRMAEFALADYQANKKNKDIKNMCAYHIQQAVEKIIKYQIYQSVNEPKNREMYTHNIGALIKYAEKENITLNVPKYILDNQEIITDWEAGSRYDLHFSIRVDTLEKALAITTEWYKSLKECKKCR